jgi:ankyrin repeat protein
MHSGLHLAANKGFFDIAKIFVQNMKDNLDGYGRDERTALVVATLKGHSDIVQLLLDNNAATDMPDINQHIPLHYAALRGDVKCVQALLSHAENQCQEEVKTAASYSVVNEELEGDTEKGAAADAGNEGHSDGCKTLGESGTNRMHPKFSQMANLDIVNNEGKTALQLASQKGSFAVVKLLLDHGANPSVYVSPDETALALAAKCGSVKAVRILLSKQSKKKKLDEGTLDEEKPEEEEPDEEKPGEEKPGEEKPGEEKPGEEKPGEEKPGEEKPDEGKPEEGTPEERTPEEGKVDIWKQNALDVALLLAVSKLSSGNERPTLMELIELLTLHGARPGPVDASGMTALHWAIKAKDESIATSLLATMKQKDKNLEKKNKKDQ